MLNLAYHWEFFAKKPAGYRDSISITAMGGLYFLASPNCSCTYRFPKYRIPVAIYGSAILFGLSHLSNFGWHGESFTATIAQVIGVMGSAFIWAELYLYTGKLWLPMIYHFLMDYISDLQSGWNSAGWSWNGEITDYIYTVLIVGVPLLFSIWMLFGKRRQVMEDNADLILNLNGRQSMI